MTDSYHYVLILVSAPFLLVTLYLGAQALGRALALARRARETVIARTEISPPPMTDADREAQRRSFAYGNASTSSPSITREDIDRAAEKIRQLPQVVQAYGFRVIPALRGATQPFTEVRRASSGEIVALLETTERGYVLTRGRYAASGTTPFSLLAELRRWDERGWLSGEEVQA